jgi:hypothetical protein
MNAMTIELRGRTHDENWVCFVKPRGQPTLGHARPIPKSFVALLGRASV